MKRWPLYCILSLAALMAGCSDYDDFTINPSSRLEFSVDTVRFDTLVNTVPSSTHSLFVHNKGKKGVRITSISLDDGAESYFRVNVDGQYLAGGVGKDFEIRRNDSIAVRVEVTLPEAGTPLPQKYEDCLTFLLENGAEQRLALEVVGKDAHIVHGMNVTGDLTLKTDMPYVIYDSLVVEKNATLTLSPGTCLMFHDKCGMDVYGKVTVNGTLEQPVVMRGDRTDHMFDYLMYDNTPNRWEGITIHQGSVGNKWTYADIHSGCKGVEVLHDNADEMCLELENCIIHNVGGDALSLNGSMVSVVNTQISNAYGKCVSVLGGNSTFVYCTLVQFYLFSSTRGDALYIANRDEDENYHDIDQAYFYNCVVTGYGDDVIMGNLSDESGDTPYLFDHCFLNTVTSDDEARFVSVVYDSKDDSTHAESNFRVFDSYNFVYDFTPVADSKIRGMADAVWNTRYPADRLGRLRGDVPCAGCYEYFEEKKEE